MSEESNVIDAVRKALGRTAPLTAAPVPPAISEPLTRLVHSDVGLPELLAKTCKENKMGVTTLGPDEFGEALVNYLREKNVKSIALPVSPLLSSLNVFQTLRDAGFAVRKWDEMSLDDVYEVDCGITDVWAAVAEVGCLVIRGTPQHGRAISLVPNLHVAIIEPKNLVPDLVDLFQKMPTSENDRWVLVTGPSKTADIEMNLVTGVHGPGVVQVFILQ
jgi:L-lactate dehydrogenase complex protein LldG